ncbi:MAG TPA: response regulator [Bacteroidales bacterium]|nr:response regulator [Bacteroidales bacterium]HOK99284.1 response regulator [Bacteroidales bacterium]HPO66296.1 response regulator [Bacteroidales bacterium]
MEDKVVTLLAIDDDPLVLKLIEASLAREPYRMLFAPDGETGLRMALENKPDLIVLDVVMPGMDGFEFCQQARKNPILKNTPIIMLTALDDRDSKIQGLEAGADDYICKPFDKIEFRARIRTITRLTQNFLSEISQLQHTIEELKKEIAQLR